MGQLAQPKKNCTKITPARSLCRIHKIYNSISFWDFYFFFVGGGGLRFRVQWGLKKQTYQRKKILFMHMCLSTFLPVYHLILCLFWGLRLVFGINFDKSCSRDIITSKTIFVILFCFCPFFLILEP